MNVRAFFPGVALVLLCAGGPALADDAARGLEIAREADRRDTGFVDYQVELEMEMD